MQWISSDSTKRRWSSHLETFPTPQRTLWARAMARRLPAAVLVVLASSAAAAETVHLEYGARKLLIKAEATVDWSEPPATNGGDGEVVISVRSRSPGEKSTLELRFLASSGAALERVQRYDDGSERRYRFLDDGVQYSRVGPAKGERSLPRDSWTGKDEQFIPAPEDFKGPGVIAPSALFYLLPRLDLEQVGDHVELWIFSKRAFVQLALEVVAKPTVVVEWIEERDGGTRRWRTPQRVVHVRATLSDDEAEGMSLLGLRGDLDFFLHPETGIPLQIGGRVPYLGHILVKLRRASWTGQRVE